MPSISKSTVFLLQKESYNLITFTKLSVPFFDHIPVYLEEMCISIRFGVFLGLLRKFSLFSLETDLTFQVLLTPPRGDNFLYFRFPPRQEFGEQTKYYCPHISFIAQLLFLRFLTGAFTLLFGNYYFACCFPISMISASLLPLTFLNVSLHLLPDLKSNFG